MLSDILGIAMNIYTVGKVVYENYQAVADSNVTCQQLVVKTQALCGVAEFLQQNQQQLQTAKELKAGSAQSLEASLRSELAKTHETIVASGDYISEFIRKKDRSILLKMLVVKKHQEQFEKFSTLLTGHLERISQYFSLLEIGSLKAEMEALRVQMNAAIAPKLEAIYSELMRSGKNQEEKHESQSQQLNQHTTLLMQILLKLNTASTLTMEELEAKAKQSYEKSDFANARRYYEEAVEKGSARAMSALGGMLASGKGGEKNEKRALELFTQSAAKLYRRGIFNLAQALFYGECGAKIDQAQAISLYIVAAGKDYDGASEQIKQIMEKADKLVDPGAQYLLATVFRNGELKGVPQDAKKATALFKRAAAQGHSKSLAALSADECFELGQGVLKTNEVLAVECFLCAAEREGKLAIEQLESLVNRLSNPQAQYALGEAYRTGRGVIVSLALAKSLYEKAATQGHEGAKTALISIETQPPSPTHQFGQRGGPALFDDTITSLSSSVSSSSSSSATPARPRTGDIFDDHVTSVTFS
jgi:TPR repeat protein